MQVAWERGIELAKRALAAGAIMDTPGHIQWDVAPRCQQPKGVEIRAKPWRASPILAADLGYAKFWRKPDVAAVLGCLETGHPGITIGMDVKCRDCPPCLRERQWQWASRGRNELARANRTWFGTLTLRPEEMAKAIFLARRRYNERVGIDTPARGAAAARAGLTFEDLPEAERFKEIHAVIGAQITRWFKRLRKGKAFCPACSLKAGKPTGHEAAELRYLLVAEVTPEFRRDGTRNQFAGLPHYHVLIHEPAEPVPWRILACEWSLGFVNFKLADEADAGTALYLCKYLSKHKQARVRASREYGRESARPPEAIGPKGGMPSTNPPLVLAKRPPGSLLPTGGQSLGQRHQRLSDRLPARLSDAGRADTVPRNPPRVDIPKSSWSQSTEGRSDARERALSSSSIQRSAGPIRAWSGWVRQHYEQDIPWPP